MVPCPASGLFGEGKEALVNRATTESALLEGQGEAGLRAYQPTIVDLSLGVARPWPTGRDFLLCVAAFVVQVVLTDDYFSLATAICGGLEAAILVLLLTNYVKVRPARLPWIELMVAEHYMQFGIALLTHPIAVGLAAIVPHRDSFEFASFVVIVSGIAMIAGFYITRFATQRLDGWSPLPKLDPKQLASASHVHFFLAASFVLVSVGVPASRTLLLPVANIIQPLLYHTPLLVVATAAYFATPRPLFLAQAIGAFIVLAVVVATTSMLSTILVPLAGVAPLWWRARERVPFVLIAAAVAIVIVLQPVKRYFRTIREFDQQSSVITSWGQAFVESASAEQSAHVQRLTADEDTVGRLSELGTLAYTVEVVPDTIPHTGGMAYPMLVTSVIPRVFWPDKPNMTEYSLNPFVIALGLTTPEAAEQSVTGISLPAQGYLEHGFAGSVGWMMLLGVMAGLASRYFGTTLAGVVVGATVLGPMCTSEGGGFQSVFGAAPQLILGATMLAWFLWLIGGGYRYEREADTRVGVPAE
jgi:hypothetical protein